MPPKKKLIENIDEELLILMSKRYNISLPEAVKRLDHCIQTTAAYYNVSYSVVYNIAFNLVLTPDEMARSKSMSEKLDMSNSPINLTVECHKLKEKQCSEASNQCFTLQPYGCLPRRIPDVDKINEDPDKYVKNHLGKTEDLKRLVHIAAYLYHNYDGGGLTDNAFDALEYHLKKREKLKGRLYEKIGALPVDKIRTQLLYGMSSLEKMKPGTSELTRYLSNFTGGTQFNKPPACAWSLKLDGVSGMAIYKNGKLTHLNTRGDGITGGDVLYLQDYIKHLPKSIKQEPLLGKSKKPKLSDVDLWTFVVRGEFIISKDNWENKYKGTYANARAFVSGKINSGFISAALHDIEFIAYEIMDDDNSKDAGMVPQPSRAFKILQTFDFKVADNSILQAPTVFELMELYTKKRLESEFFIDGLVLSVDKVRPAVPLLGKNTVVPSPIHTIAFKMMLEEQMRSTKVINVEWNISRYGRYVPVAIYEAVYVDGVRMARATGHNAAHIRDWNMGQGTKIKVVRSGDVIPQIKDVTIDGTIIPIFPLNYGEVSKTDSNIVGYEWHWEKQDIILDDIENNKEVHIKRIIHFFETLDVPKLGPKTVEKLYEAGYHKPESIVKATVFDFQKIKGIGKKSAEGFYNNIRDTIAKTPPDRFIVASTTFQSGLGRKLLKQLFKYIPHLLNMNEQEITSHFKSHKIAGFGPSRIKTVAIGKPEFRKYLDSFAKKDVEKAMNFYLDKIKELDKTGRNVHIAGRKFVTTGFMSNFDYDLEDYIYNNNGDFVGTVTSDIAAVICGNIMEISKKMKAAAQLGVPVYTLQEFAERFNLPSGLVKMAKVDDSFKVC